MPTAADAQLRLRQLGSAKSAAAAQRFFKTGPGEYGEGDIFLGVATPVMRRLAREFETLSLGEADLLLQSPIHEDRLLALMVLVRQYDAGDAKTRQRIYRLYLRRRGFVNNWDLVDSSAHLIVGPHLAADDGSAIRKLAASSRLWDRRIAVVATLHLIRANRFDLTLDLARQLFDDRHDLMHKAVGWMLREVGKRDVTVLRTFLKEYAPRLPRTTLRYAIERFPEAERRRFLAIKRVKTHG